METVKGLFSDKNKDFVTEVDEQNIILVKDATELRIRRRGGKYCAYDR